MRPFGNTCTTAESSAVTRGERNGSDTGSSSSSESEDDSRVEDLVNEALALGKIFGAVPRGLALSSLSN